MSFRKFGQSDDQKVAVDKEDDQGLSKTASKVEWTEKDAEDLRKESQK